MKNLREKEPGPNFSLNQISIFAKYLQNFYSVSTNICFQLVHLTSWRRRELKTASREGRQGGKRQEGDSGRNWSEAATAPGAGCGLKDGLGDTAGG